MAKGKEEPKAGGGGLLYSAAAFMQKLSPRPVRVRGVRGEFKVDVKGEFAEGSDYTIIPDIDDPAIKVEDFYPVNPPFVYARILYDNNRNEHIYESIEPQLSAKELALYELVKDTFQRTVGYELDKLGNTNKAGYIRECINQFVLTRKIPVSDIQKEKIIYYVVRDFVGYGIIDPLIADERVEDVSCDGTNVPLFIFHQKFESIKTSTVYPSDDELDSYVIALAQRCTKQISVAMPILDGTSPEGHRVQATYGHEVTTRGSSFTIRRFKERPFTPTDIVNANTASCEMIAYMWLAVEHGDSMIVVGGTASGKTSTLNAATLFIPPAAKIVSMEDTREINLPHENWIPGATRSGFGERGVDGKAAGEIDMFDLVRAALRQRPNYIIVGEVRGKETYTMFQAMATGHTTYSTMHADSVRSMVNRLENPPINCPRILLTALNFVIVQTHARVRDLQVRRIKQIVEIIGFEPETNELITNTVFEWDQVSDKFVYKGHSFLFDKIQEIKNLTHDEMMEEFNRRVEIVNHMIAKNLTDFIDLAKIIVSYYKEPEDTLARIRQDKGKGGE